jgi:1-acyl-sn-glycerol-3-phosphate acyltransferase
MSRSIPLTKKNESYPAPFLDEIRRPMVTGVLQFLLGLLCKIESREFAETLRDIAQENGRFAGLGGTAILAINHVNFLEVPMLVVRAAPYKVTGLAKDESWENPVMAFLMNTYEAIPINREGSYRESFTLVREVMDRGSFIIIAPEGSRNGNGILRQGKGGIIQLALATGAPVLPVVHFGGEKFWENFRRFRRTPFIIKVGRPFRFKCEDGRPGKSVRKVMIDELMGQMAALLPEELRGIYGDRVGQECTYLEFL